MKKTKKTRTKLKCIETCEFSYVNYIITEVPSKLTLTHETIK